MGKGCSARTGTVCKGKALECKSMNVQLRWTVSCHW